MTPAEGCWPTWGVGSGSRFQYRLLSFYQDYFWGFLQCTPRPLNPIPYSNSYKAPMLAWPTWGRRVRS